MDTHTFLWWVFQDRRLSETARRTIAEPANTAFVSAASAWEITTKHRLGRLAHAAVVAADVAREVAAEGFHELPVSLRHAQLAGALAIVNQDPFDRMLVAQALHEAMPLVSIERDFEQAGVTRIW